MKRLNYIRIKFGKCNNFFTYPQMAGFCRSDGSIWRQSDLTTLMGGASLEALIKQAEELYVADKAPGGLVDETGRDFANEALDAEGRAEAFQHVNEEVEVFVQAEARKVLRASCIFLLHTGAFDYLKLMEFHRAEREFIDHGT